MYIKYQIYINVWLLWNYILVLDHYNNLWNLQIRRENFYKIERKIDKKYDFEKGKKEKKKGKQKFHCPDLNPGLLGESQVSQPTRLQRIGVQL